MVKAFNIQTLNLSNEYDTFNAFTNNYGQNNDKYDKIKSFKYHA